MYNNILHCQDLFMGVRITQQLNMWSSICVFIGRHKDIQANKAKPETQGSRLLKEKVIMIMLSVLQQR